MTTPVALMTGRSEPRNRSASCRWAVASMCAAAASLSAGNAAPFSFAAIAARSSDAASRSAPVVAAATGRVIVAGWQHGYGQVVYIDHGSGLTTRYGHLSQIGVKVGQNVLRGENLGRVGSSGRSTGPHLHYEVRIKENPVNPLPYLTGVN